MRFFIDVLYLAAAPFVFAYLLFLSRLFTRRRYREGLARKLLGTRVPRSGDRRRTLFVHAVSVGEVRTALPLVRAFAASPAWRVILSTSTDTGREAALAALRTSDGRDRDGVEVIYWPFDFSWAVGRTLRSARPDAVLLVELELWPNALLSCRRLGIPAYVVNGRLTERSRSRYERTGALGRFLFSLPAAYAVQSEAYAERFASLGVPRDRIEALGNLKFDVAPPQSSAAEREATLRALGGGESTPRVLMGACTHRGEESTLLEFAVAELARHPDLRLVLAPRHIERAGDVIAEARRAGLGEVAAWSGLRDGEAGSSAPAPRVLVVDVIGELDRFYAVADVVFVGGSLIPHGGHNVLEPARHGTPILFGRSTHNFEEICAHLLEREAAIRVSGPAELRAAIAGLLDSPEARSALGERALAAARELAGALQRHLEWLRGLGIDARLPG